MSKPHLKRYKGGWGLFVDGEIKGWYINIRTAARVASILWELGARNERR